MLKIGYKVQIISGVYQDQIGTIVGVTKCMYRIRLKSGMSVRIMKHSVGYYHQNTVVWRQQLYQDLQYIRNCTRITAVLLSKLKFIMVTSKSDRTKK